MDIEQIIASMTPELYQRLATAVELGKWPDGVALTPEQKENSMQLVMLWQARNNTDAQHMTIDQRSDGDEEQTAIERGFRYRAEADCDVQTAVTCRTERPV